MIIMLQFILRFKSFCNISLHNYPNKSGFIILRNVLKLFSMYIVSNEAYPILYLLFVMGVFLNGAKLLIF
jgi:hypothetical protein